MYICLCHAVSKKVLEELHEEGCKTVREIQNECQAGKSCGACVPDLKKLLKEKICQSSR